MKQTHTHKIGIILVSGLLAISGSAFADKDKHSHKKSQQQFVYGKVIQAEPVYDIITTNTPIKQCWQEPVTVSRPYRIRQGHDSGAATLAGGLIGGIIGHQFGKGNGRRVATAVGTLVGAQIAHDNAYSGYVTTEPEVVSYRDVCEVSHQSSYQKVLEGYQVTYRYKGNQYETRMPYDPGDRVKLKVSINPVF